MRPQVSKRPDTTALLSPPCLPRYTHTKRVALLTVLASFLSVGSVCLSADRHAVDKSLQPPTSCPAPDALKSLLSLGSIYLGENHGTQEAPTLVRCLVDAKLASGVTNLSVSLEIPAHARDTTNPFWANLDGRASKAMLALVTYLESLEKQGKISLDFQVTGQEQGDEEMNRKVGLHLRELSAKRSVIALGGNVHSQRRQVLIPSFPVKPAGAYMGDSIKSVMIDPVEDGHAWDCGPKCGVHEVKTFSGEPRVGALIDGNAAGHDYIYTVRTFTPSPPAISNERFTDR